jgi:hypothetical protein
LLPIETRDAAGLTIKGVQDYGVFQPREITDPNGNRTACGYTPLGLVKGVAIMGREGEAVGDTPDQPGTSFVYDLLAFADPARRQPVSVRTIRRVHHARDLEVPQPGRDETIETVEYSDGFGRLLQTRARADDVLFGDPARGDEVLPADQTDTQETLASVASRKNTDPDRPNVVVSGWQVYDNKGRVVEKYEPLDSVGWDYRTPDEERSQHGPGVLGQKAAMIYDPLGRVVRTISPDGSEQRVVHGVPGTIATPMLTNPDAFEPTPWEAYTYAVNDNALRSRIGTLSIFIIVLGVGFAALRESDDAWECGIFTLTLGAPLVSILLAIHRSEEERAFWVGFALFGGGIPGAVPGLVDRVQVDHEEAAGLYRLQGAQIEPGRLPISHRARRSCVGHLVQKSGSEQSPWDLERHHRESRPDRALAPCPDRRIRGRAAFWPSLCRASATGPGTSRPTVIDLK